MTNSTLKQNDSRERNLAKSLFKSAVVNLGVQALGKNLNKDNFWQTLLVGAAGGFGDYFGGNVAMGAILGGGNALINKSNFLGTTAKYAALSFAADGALKIAEAKAEELPEKDKWETVWDSKLPKGDLNFVAQANPRVGCTQAVLESIAMYLNKPIIFTEYNNGYDFYDYAANKNKFTVKTIYNGTRAKTSELKSLETLCEETGKYLQAGWPVAATYFNGEFYHTVGIMQITKKRKLTKGIYKYRYDIKMMNPADSGDKYLPEYNFEKSVIRAVNPFK